MNTLLYTADHICLIMRLKAQKGCIHTVAEEVYKTIAPTHKEEGCLEYRLLQQGDSIVVLGKWKSQMALDLHLLLQFHVQLVEEILPPLCKKIKIQSYKEVEPPITALSLG
jgi:quinol monooxygenase YgiN